MPGLDLRACRICGAGAPLLFKEGNQAAAAQARVYLGRGQVGLLQRTEVKKRARRKPDSHVHTGWPRIPRSQEPITASARPTRSSIGKNPTPPSRSGTRLSAELSRLSPITNR